MIAGRVLLATLFVLVAANLYAAVRDPEPFAFAGGRAELSWRQQEILRVRSAVHGCQNELHRPKRPVAERIVGGGPAYRAWVLRSWRADRKLFCGAVRALNADPVRAIRYVFGRHGDAAVRVAACETGRSFSVWARNGQYLGMFQMGSSERALYGHGPTPLQQAWAAHRYFLASGSDWSPWACRSALG